MEGKPGEYGLEEADHLLQVLRSRVGAGLFAKATAMIKLLHSQFRRELGDRLDVPGVRVAQPDPDAEQLALSDPQMRAPAAAGHVRPVQQGAWDRYQSSQLVIAEAGNPAPKRPTRRCHLRMMPNHSCSR